MMKMRLTKILGILVLAGAAACNPFRNSIHDTLYGSDTDSSYKTRDVTTGESRTVTYNSTSRTSTVTIHSSSSTQSGFLANAAQLEAAERGLRSVPALSGKDIYLYESIHFYDDGRIMLKVQHPDNPAYIDQYYFRDGHWGEPEPVQLSVHDNIQTALVKLEEVSFKNVAAVYRNYRAKSDSILGAEQPTHIYVILRNQEVNWYPHTISGSRERYYISFHPDGSLDRYYRE